MEHLVILIQVGKKYLNMYFKIKMDIIIVSLIVLLFFGCIYYFLGQDLYNTIIVGNMQTGTQESESSQKQVTEMSVAGWIRIDDYDFKYGHEKVIFVKGSPDLSIACPALTIDGNTNTLLVKLDTFGAQKIIPVNNVPAKKWVHFAITINEHDLKIYVNGIEYASEYLSQLPKSNNSPIVVSPNGGFSGRTANLKFFEKTLNYQEIVQLSKDIPSTGSETNQVFPPYFDISWFKP